MLTFRAFLVEEAGTYAAYKLDDASCEALHKHVLDSQIPNPKDPSDYHVTTVYSTKGVPYVPSQLSFNMQPQGYDVFGHNPVSQYLVLKVHHDHLHDRWNYAKSLGATSTFPDYKPHITLTDPINKDFDHTQLALPNFDITASHEYAGALNEWFRS